MALGFVVFETESTSQTDTTTRERFTTCNTRAIAYEALLRGRDRGDRGEPGLNGKDGPSDHSRPSCSVGLGIRCLLDEEQWTTIHTPRLQPCRTQRSTLDDDIPHKGVNVVSFLIEAHLGETFRINDDEIAAQTPASTSGTCVVSAGLEKAGLAAGKESETGGEVPRA